jgi:hypothetical protein
MFPGDERTDVTARINHLIDEYRIRCLWFMRLDYFPTTDAERARLLEYIERHGDREGFQRARELRRWLSQHSSESSAA